MNTPNSPDESRDQRLDDAIAQLPRDVAPPADVWPAVRGRLVLREPRRTASRSAIVLAAAAALLLATSVLLLRLPAERPGLTPVANTNPAADMTLLADLTAELEARRDVLSPETIAIVEQNLRTINIAIAQTAKALADDPGNVQLELMLTQVTRQRDAFVRETRSLVGDL